MHEQRQKERDAAIRKKEKEEEKIAKERIKAKIEQDKREREAKKKNEGSTTIPASSNPATPSKLDFNEALIQVRLPDGNTIKATFKPTDPVRTVHNHIAMLIGTENFSLLTTFPKNIFSPREPSIDKVTLKQAELVPSGTFIVTKL